MNAEKEEDYSNLRFRDPENMTPEERRKRIVELLALAVARTTYKHFGLSLELPRERRYQFTRRKP